MFKHNVGTLDRVVRLGLGAAILALLFVLPAPFHWIGLLGLVPVVTGLVGSCPLYSLVGIKTCRVEHA
jgi:hypothetical protein